MWEVKIQSARDSTPDKEAIIKVFVEKFVRKDKRERCYLQLTNPKKRHEFINRLNHSWDTILNMKYVNQIDKTLDYPEDIQKLLAFRDDELCYVISSYDNVDDRFMAFKEVFDKVYSRGLASLLIDTSADTFFLDTEQVHGPADRFIGHIKA